MHPPFDSIHALRTQFNAGLYQLAQQPQLGAFILACANATMDTALLHSMRAALQQQYQSLLTEYQAKLRSGQPLNTVEEDLLVFLKIHAIGFTAIGLTESRTEGEWQIHFNHLRSFRPQRITQCNPQQLFLPFNKNDFHFNKPFMARECFWRGELLGHSIDLFYNKYPFADLHGLLVIDRLSEQPQLLTEAYHHYLFRLTTVLSATLSGIAFGYNSYGAHASVNHCHFQMFIDPAGLPISHSHWQHNGGDRIYPLHCRVFDDAGMAWQFILQLHQQITPYNLLYMPGKLYVIPRATQNAIALPSWASGFSWFELSGAILTFNREDYLNLRAQEIARNLQLAKLPSTTAPNQP